MLTIKNNNMGRDIFLAFAGMGILFYLIVIAISVAKRIDKGDSIKKIITGKQ